MSTTCSTILYRILAEVGEVSALRGDRRSSMSKHAVRNLLEQYKVNLHRSYILKFLR